MQCKESKIKELLGLGCLLLTSLFVKGINQSAVDDQIRRRSPDLPCCCCSDFSLHRGHMGAGGTF